MKLLPAILMFIWYAFAAVESKAQEIFWSGSRFQALADASVGMSGCWSAGGNQAGLAGITSQIVAGSFHNRFMISELSTHVGLLILPVQSSVFALSFSQFGQIPFRQEKFGLAYARRIMPKLNFGVQFNCYRLFLSEENRSVSSFGSELGFQYLFSEDMVIGFHVVNPYRTNIRLSSGNFQYHSRISLGTFCRLSELFSLTSELENNLDRHLVVKTGIEFKISDEFFVRTGVAGKPYRLSAGLGFKVKGLILDLATTYDEYLGNSPSVSFQYQF